MLISSIKIIFQIYGRKYPNKVFLVPFLVAAEIIACCCLIFGIWINSRVLISNMTIAFLNFSLKVLKKALFDPSLRIFIFAQTLHFHKFEGADFKYDNNFSNLQPKITEIRHFWL